MGRSKAKKHTWYKQCMLTTPTEAGELCQTAWIPEQFAVVGRTVLLGKKSENPTQLWTVKSAPDQRQSGEYLGEHERDYLTQRQASDI